MLQSNSVSQGRIFRVQRRFSPGGQSYLCLCQKKAEDAKRAISEAIGKTKSKVKKSAMKNSTGCNIFAQQDANDSFQVESRAL